MWISNEKMGLLDLGDMLHVTKMFLSKEMKSVIQYTTKMGVQGMFVFDNMEDRDKAFAGLQKVVDAQKV